MYKLFCSAAWYNIFINYIFDCKCFVRIFRAALWIFIFSSGAALLIFLFYWWGAALWILIEWNVYSILHAKYNHYFYSTSIWVQPQNTWKFRSKTVVSQVMRLFSSSLFFKLERKKKAELGKESKTTTKFFVLKILIDAHVMAQKIILNLQHLFPNSL